MHRARPAVTLWCAYLTCYYASLAFVAALDPELWRVGGGAYRVALDVADVELWLFVWLVTAGLCLGQVVDRRPGSARVAMAATVAVQTVWVWSVAAQATTDGAALVPAVWAWAHPIAVWAVLSVAGVADPRIRR